jgi:hypothetical protein
MSDPEIVGLDAVILKLDRMPATVRASLLRAVTEEGGRVTRRVQEKLQGEVLKERTHRLHDAVHLKVGELPSEVIGIVGTAGTNVRYAAYQEYGFHGVEQVRAHIRRVSVAFGRSIPTVIASVRAHSRHVNYPAHSFLRSTLVEMAPEIRVRLAAAVAEGEAASP